MFFSKKRSEAVDHDSGFFSLSSPSLEKGAEELRQLRLKQRAALNAFNDQHDEFHQVDQLRTRISFITRRNKDRSILVIPFVKKDNPLVGILLRSNSNATAKFARNLEDGIARLKKDKFDMVYLVLDFAREGHGPCFMSESHPDDAGLRAENEELVEYATLIKGVSGKSEIVFVCGTAQAQCPIAKKLFEVECDGSNKKEAV